MLLGTRCHDSAAHRHEEVLVGRLREEVGRGRYVSRPCKVRIVERGWMKKGEVSSLVGRARVRMA